MIGGVASPKGVEHGKRSMVKTHRICNVTAEPHPRAGKIQTSLSEAGVEGVDDKADGAHVRNNALDKSPVLPSPSSKGLFLTISYHKYCPL